MSVRDFDAMAERLNATTVELADGGTYVPAYVDADARVLHLWRGVRMKWAQVPFRGPISGLRVVTIQELPGYKVEPIWPPVRHAKTAEGTFASGFFDPRRRVFYRWRGRELTQLPSGVDPAAELLIPDPRDLREVPVTVVEIDPPVSAPQAAPSP